jgi:NAD(P)-dependent dehydrogenase (short-subunit alcohol dehydrogenase family)
VHLPEEDDGKETVRLVEQAGREGPAIVGDLRGEDVCRQVVEQTVSELGGLDLLVHDAVYQTMQPGGIADISTEQLDRMFRAAAPAARLEHPHRQLGAGLRAEPGADGPRRDQGGPGQHHQEPEPAARPEGDPVNTVAPGPIWRPLVPATMVPEMVEGFGSERALGRAGQPTEVAAAFVFLASDAASHITGGRIGVAGGMPVP